MNDERFDALWADMKARVKEARERRIANSVEGVSANSDAMFPGIVRVCAGSFGTATVVVSKDLYTSCGATMSANQLLTVAAHCVLAAQEIEDHRVKRETEAMVSEALAPLGDRFPADDEQKRA